MGRLSGWKTYATAIAVAVVGAGYGLGYIDEHTRDSLLTLLGAAGLASARHAISRGPK